MNMPEEVRKFLKKIDGYIPSHTPQSKGKFQHLSGWTILTIGDYSSDSRPGSNAGLIAEGLFSLEELLEFARKNFPKQMQRIEAAGKITLI